MPASISLAVQTGRYLGRFQVDASPLHRCEIVAIEGESYRLKEAKARSEKKAATRAAAPRKGKTL